MDCDICRRNKPQKARCESKGVKAFDSLPVPVSFGDAGTLDHKIIYEDDASRDGDRNACGIFDCATYWLQAYGDTTKSAKATISALQTNYGLKIPEVCKHIYVDNSDEIRAACEHFYLSHDISTAHRSETNGIAENAIRRVEEGTSCTMSQSGLCDAWWKEAMECYCFLKNVVEIVWTKKTSDCMRFKEDFRGPIVPFGVEVQYFQLSAEDQARGHQMADKWLCGIFAGYKQHAGGGWAKNLKVIDWYELDESKHISQVYLRDLPADQVWPQMKDGRFIFPFTNGDLNHPGFKATEMSRRKVKRDGQQREKEKEEEEKNKLEDKLKAEKEEKQEQRDIHMKAEDFWTLNSSFITRHHKRPRFEKYDPTEADCPMPLKWFDVMRFTSTSPPEAGMRSIDD